VNTPETTPVIIGIGEYTERPASIAEALEPIALMSEALHQADRDGGGGLLERLDSLEVVAFMGWRYVDPVRRLCSTLGIDPARKSNASMGGETPIRLIHEAALGITRGELSVAAIVGGEALHSIKRARKEHAKLPWPPLVPEKDAVPSSSPKSAISGVAKALGVTEPVRIYPFYEMATQAAWGLTPAQAQRESAALWAQYAAVASQNPYAWIRTSPSAEVIATVGAENRLVAWPYPKLMVANPTVNQSAATIVTSLAIARAAGIPEQRLVHIWGGASASEPEHFLLRDRYDHSTAQAATLEKAVEIVGGEATAFDRLELYSCFPVVPKMALRTLGLDPARHAPTVTGGLTFFGGPINNYMSHAFCAMVRALREAPQEVGLLYAQGGYVTKHHALVVSASPAASPLALNYSVQEQADQARGPVPAVVEHYSGPATIETYTVLYDNNGEPLDGCVIVRTPDGSRTMARVYEDDTESMALLQSPTQSAIGRMGHVRVDAFGKPVWRAGDAAPRTSRTRRFSLVEREGPLTIVTINLPESMNALHPSANAELAEIFDDFAADPDQWVAILTGAGDKAFSAGNDLKFTARAMARGARVETPVAGFGGLTARFDLEKPVIAAVNGVAMGGGFEIALACDIIIASENAVFGLPEPRVGLAALSGGLLRLPREIGLKQAMGIILTGRKVSAAEGLRLGFVNETSKPADLLATAKRWAADIVALSPMSIRASKQIVHKALDSPSIAEAFREQSRHAATRALFRSADLKEGPLAFAQKRAPQWKGR
jgi:acetyl-CoA C-acetyltransferase